jgi:hypothetical protein
LDNVDLNRVRDNEQNLRLSSSSSSSRPPISAYRQLLQYKEAAGFTNQAEFVCPGMAKEKDRAAKLEALAKESIDEMNKANKSYTQLIVERSQEKDPSIDFLSTSQKIAMKKFYSKDPTAIPVKEVKPLRYNKMDKFAAKIETNVDIIGNAVVKSIKAFEDNKPHLAMFHLTNIVDLARDTRSETNLKRLEVRDFSSAALIKRHTDGATIVSPAMQEVIKEEKNQGFKRQNYYYKNRNYRRNFFNGFSHGYNSSTFQLAQATQKLSSNNQFFLNRGGDSLQSRSNYQPTYPKSSCGRGNGCGFRGKQKY